MKINNLYKICLLFVVIMATLATAYPVGFNMDSPDGTFTTAIYHCTTSACDTTDSYVGSFTGDPHLATIPNTYSGTHYFALYTYNNGFVPHTYRVQTTSATGAGPWPVTVDFNTNITVTQIYLPSQLMIVLLNR